MKKITATVIENIRSPHITSTVTGYKAEAWNSTMIVTKFLGYWQVYDTDSRCLIVSIADSRKDALDKLKNIQKDISQSFYEKCRDSAKLSQGRMRETEQEIYFQLNKMYNENLRNGIVI